MSLSITKGLETYAEKAAAMLAHLAGKTLSEIEEACVTPDEIFQQLSSIIAYIEECGELLYSRHSESEDVLAGHIGNKLISKGIVGKKLSFLSNPKDLIKLHLNILLARLGRDVMINGNNIAQSNRSTSYMPESTLSLPDVRYQKAIDIANILPHTIEKAAAGAGGVGL